jgi:hypothetical protein
MKLIQLLKLGSYYNFDPYEIIKICNLHPRVKILNPGPGVGGHCIPIDPWFLVGQWPFHTDLIKLALEINESMPEFVLKHINKIIKNHNITDNSKIGIYGLTYYTTGMDYYHNTIYYRHHATGNYIQGYGLYSYHYQYSDNLFYNNIIDIEGSDIRATTYGRYIYNYGRILSDYNIQHKKM